MGWHIVGMDSRYTYASGHGRGERVGGDRITEPVAVVFHCPGNQDRVIIEGDAESMRELFAQAAEALAGVTDGASAGQQRPGG